MEKITERQEKLLDFLIKEYISTAEPVGSISLKKTACLNVCGATVRNDLQVLSKQGFIEQPHTSAGRVPTQKAYKYFAEKFCSSQKEEVFSDFILNEIERAKQQIENEMRLTEELMNSLSEVSMTLNYTRIQKSDNLLEILEILGPSKTTHNENINLISKIIKQLETF
jgi:heat-inducible transcriptional repressor